ncbi:hypothetical protein AB0C02_16125 [Micromonospora sp. NPDC048999]|uniref:hypothetical protein n=1 Tax=Micromonospora sp. NPDC048999 TaxID=3155391 RepID=UPI003403C858
MVTRPHTPIRPLWLCRACTAPWPCPTARLTLLREYANDRVALLVYLGGMLHDAAGELRILHPDHAPEPGQLFDRFLGWARRPTTTSPGVPDETPPPPPLPGDSLTSSSS